MRPFPACVLAIALLAAAMPGALAADLLVIVSARSKAPALGVSQVAAIFLGQKAQFPDGAEVTAIDQAVGAPARDAFYARVAAKNPALLKAYWSKQLFTGRGQPPQEVADSAAVKKLVADTPGMIGYIDSAALDATVRVLLVVR